MVIGSRSSKYYVYGDGRWREVDAGEGSVSGWGRVRFVVSRRGKLHVVRRGRILAALRALAASRRSAVKLGPRLPNKRPLVIARRNSQSLSTQTAPVKHCHCCQHVENNRCKLMQSAPGLSMPIIETEPLPAQAADAAVQTSLTPAGGQAAAGPTGPALGAGAKRGPLFTFKSDPVTSSSSTSETLADVKLSQNKKGVKRKLSSSTEDTSQETSDNVVSQSILKREYNERFLRSMKVAKREGRSTKVPKIARRTLRSSTVLKISDSDAPLVKVSDKTDSDVLPVNVSNKSRTQSSSRNKSKKKSSGETCRELMISEVDVAVLRSYLARSLPGFDRRRYDRDASYKAGFFYAINPLVAVERSRRVDRLLEARERTSVERFASRLGLRRSVSQTSSPRLRSAPASAARGSPRPRPVTRRSLLSPRPTSTPLRASLRPRPAPAPVPTSTDSDTDKENFDTSSTRRVTRGPIVTPNHSRLNDVTITKSKSRKNVRDPPGDGSKKESNDNVDSGRSKNNSIDASKKSSSVNINNNEYKNKNNNDISKKETNDKKGSEQSKKESNVNKNYESKKESNNNNNRDRSKNVKNDRHVSEKESNKTNSNSSITGKDKQPRIELDRTEVLSGVKQTVSHKNVENVGGDNDTDDIDRQLRQKVKELDKKNNSVSKEYSSMEDHAIVAWISSGQRASLVNGNRVWRELEPVFCSLAGRERSWHSLRNRYLRHLLPSLGSMALPPKQQQQLRAAAARGEIKKRFEDRRNSIFGKVDTGASSRYRPAAAPSPPPRPPQTRQSLSSPRPAAAPSPPPSPPRTRKSLRYSEVTRQFAARHRSPSPSPSPSPPSPRAPPAGSTRSGRRLYNPNTAL